MNFKKLLILVAATTSNTTFASDTPIVEQLIISQNAISLCRVLEASGSEFIISGEANGDVAVNLKKLKNLNLGELNAKIGTSYSSWEGIPKVEQKDQISENIRMSDCVLKAFPMLSQDYQTRLELKNNKQYLLNQQEKAAKNNKLPRIFVFSGNRLSLLPGFVIEKKAGYGLGDNYILEISTPENGNIDISSETKEMVDFKDESYYISFHLNKKGQIILKLENYN